MSLAERKRCNKCRRHKLIKRDFYIRRSRPGVMSVCKRCAIKIHNAWQRRMRKAGDIGFICRVRAIQIRRYKVKRGIVVMERLAEHLRELWAKQQGLCYYTGIAMCPTGYHTGERDAMTVDRKVPNRGYVRGNIVLCRSIVNRVKQDLTHAELLKLCRKLLGHAEGKST